MLWIAGWIFFSALIGLMAARKGLTGFGYFLLSMIISPLLGLVFVLAAPADHGRREREQIAAGELRPCPECAEPIRPQAIKCRHCGAAVTPEQ